MAAAELYTTRQIYEQAQSWLKSQQSYKWIITASQKDLGQATVISP